MLCLSQIPQSLIVHCLLKDISGKVKLAFPRTTWGARFSFNPRQDRARCSGVARLLLSATAHGVQK